MQLLILLSVLGCGFQELSQSWQLDRLRILGAQANPPEARPGEIVTFQSLVFTPSELELESVVWFTCLPEDSSNFGCTLDPALTEQFEDGNMEDLGFEDFVALKEAGFAGIETATPLPDEMAAVESLLAPSWEVPSDALDSLDETAKLEGLSAFTSISAMPVGAETEDDMELAYKRFVVSESTAPNQNPSISAMQIDGQAHPQEEEFIAEAGSSYDITPILSEDSIEDYVFITRDGTEEARTEQPYFLWYTEGGSFEANETITLHPYTTTTWVAPEGPFVGKIITVVRDRRGGVAWNWISVRVD